MIAVLDGHNDSLRRALEADGGFLAGGELSLPGAAAGGFRAGLFACFAFPIDFDFGDTPTDRPPDPVMPDPFEREPAREQTSRMLAIAAELEAAAPDRFRIARSHADLVSALDGGPLTAVLHLEGAEAVDPSLSDLEAWVTRGVRSIGPVWSRRNAFAEGVPFAYGVSPEAGSGLTDAGRALVRRCASLRVLIDLAHMNGPGFWDVARLELAPLVVSHTAAWAIAPTARNLTDEQLREVGRSGGVVGLTFHIGDLRRDGLYDPDFGLDVLVDHLAHIASVAGMQSVALGSDFDGAVMPACMRDASALPTLLDALSARGFSDCRGRRDRARQLAARAAGRVSCGLGLSRSGFAALTVKGGIDGWMDLAFASSREAPGRVIRMTESNCTEFLPEFPGAEPDGALRECYVIDSRVGRTEERAGPTSSPSSPPLTGSATTAARARHRPAKRRSYAGSSSTRSMPAGSLGRSRASVSRLPRNSTMSMPLVTWPKAVCLPSSQGVAAAVTRKNWEPFVFGPALAIASVPLTILWSLISSSKV